MLVVLPYFSGDQPMALKLSKWIAELGGCRNHAALIAHDYRTNPQVDAEIKDILSEAFKSVEVLKVTGDVWSSWPRSPNHMFSTTARYIEYAIKTPWLWLEVDTMPLCKDWLDTLDTEYKRGGKPFMGAFVPAVHGSVDHLSGVAVYPGELANYAGEYYFSEETPFDLVGARQAVPQSHFTDLIQHKWGREWKGPNVPTVAINTDFADYDAFRKVVTSEAVLFHGDKNLSLVEILRPKLFPERGDVKCIHKQRNNQSATADTSSPAPSVPSTEAAGIPTLKERRQAQAAKMRAAKAAKKAANFVQVGPTVSIMTDQQPWKDKSLSLAEIQLHSERLKQFCTAPMLTKRVRDELKTAGVIK